MGLSTYGVQVRVNTGGWGQDGPRLLTSGEWNEDGGVKVVKNPTEVIIQRPTGFPAEASMETFQGCQEIMAKRGLCQRGIPRVRVPSKYPLASHVWDLTDGCGHPMYAMTSGQRPLYVCGRYTKTADFECEHNAVDGEALLSLILTLLHQNVENAGGREALRLELEKLAAAETVVSKCDQAASDLHRLKNEQSEITRKLNRITDNLALAESDTERVAIRAKFKEFELKLKDITQRVKGLEQEMQKQAGADDIDAEIDQALALYDHLERLTADTAARAEIPKLLGEINLNVFLDFETVKKGKRDVRKLKAGLITTGDAPWPVTPYGASGTPEQIQAHSSNVALPPPAAITEVPTIHQSSESASFTKGNRGDRI